MIDRISEAAPAVLCLGFVAFCVAACIAASKPTVYHHQQAVEACHPHAGIRAEGYKELVCVDGAEFRAVFSGVREHKDWERRP